MTGSADAAVGDADPLGLDSPLVKGLVGFGACPRSSRPTLTTKAVTCRCACR